MFDAYRATDSRRLATAGLVRRRTRTHPAYHDQVEEQQMTDGTHVGALTALMLSELRTALISSGLFEGINLHVTQQDDRALIHIMAVSTSSLGVLLATLTDPAELDDPDSLSCRITPGDRQTGPDQWLYELAASRYPGDHAIALSAKLLPPIADVPEVVSRLRLHR